MSPERCKKDPDEVKVFTFDWTRALNTGATVTGTNTWVASPTGPTFSSLTIVGGLLTSALVSGGTAGTRYEVTNRVTTSDGETLEETGVLDVRASDA